MIAKIGKESNIYGAILYNQQKVDRENGAVLLLNKIPDIMNGRYSVAYFNKCFELYLSANITTGKTVRHISLNLDPKDKVAMNSLRKWHRNIWNVWVTVISLILFSNIRTLTERISISFQPA